MIRMEIKPGVLVRSKAGRDKGHVYAAIDLDEKHVYVADGAERPLRHMKKKNTKHLQPILKMRVDGTPDDMAIRNVIRKYEDACGRRSRL